MSPAARFAAWRFVHPDLDPGAPGLRADATGGIELVSGDASIRQAILILLSTRPGERVMRPDYGCDPTPFLFSPNDDTTAGIAIHFVRQAIERWEPRVEVLTVDANRDPLQEGLMQVSVSYRVRASGEATQMALAIGPPAGGG